ncbi:hypothetical protein DL93DRAFT_2225266 [Clavulina sp. PMI_390]|nr:hypothetical protein DL93DRAFT_2225266 [Clavulina sp. PMI_390]
MRTLTTFLMALAMTLQTSASPLDLEPSARTVATPNCAPATKVTWLNNCQSFGYNASIDIPGVECGVFTAPLDYADCSPGSATIAVARLNATVSPRLGTIFTNPGGPGESGVSLVFTQAQELSVIIGGQYDIVSWDPRAVGLSTPTITCFSSLAEIDALSANNSIISNGGPEAYGNFTNPAGDDPDELAALAQEAITDTHLGGIAAACLNMHGNNLSYVGTAAAVRDMIALSDAIEGPGKKVNYWGFSYGTVIGSFFINMFPERVGRVIMDGVVDPIPWTTSPYLGLHSSQVVDAHLVFDEFTSSCAAAGSLCAIAGANATQSSVAALVQKMMDGAFLTYQANPSTTTISSAALRQDLYQGLYFPYQWPTLASALLDFAISLNISEALALPKPSGLSSSRSTGIRKRASPSFLDSSGSDSNNIIANNIASMAITCADSPDAGNITTQDMFDALLATANVSQTWGPTWVGNYICHKWPKRAVERYTGPWNASLPEKVLVIANQGDPITPKGGAELVASMLGNSSAFLLRDGYGHTSLGEASTCTSAVISQYFTNGTTPALGTVCSTDRNYFGSSTVSNDSSSSSVIPTSAIYSATSAAIFTTSTSAPNQTSGGSGLEVSALLVGLASVMMVGSFLEL